MLGRLGWGQLAQGALAFGGLHLDVHPASLRHLLGTAAGHPRLGRAQRTVDRRDKSQKARFSAPSSAAPGPFSQPSPYQKVVFRKPVRQEQKVSTGFCFSQVST